MFRKAAELNWGPAQVNLGDCYRYDKGVGDMNKQTRYRTAAEWYQKADANGNKNADTHLKAMRSDFRDLGKAYYNGKGVEQNYALAVYWYREAAELDDREAQDELGKCYYDGKGVEKNSDQAKYWWLRSAKNGGRWAALKLEEIYGENWRKKLEHIK